METSELLKEIKRSFRLYMNGEASRSMREKGLDYKINWGVSQVELRRMAGKYGKNRELAEALWAERNIRECRLLATLVMPAGAMTATEAIEWAMSAASVEHVEALMFNLLQYVVHADSIVEEMLRASTSITRIGAYNLVPRLLKRRVGCSAGMYAALFEGAKEDLGKLKKNTTAVDRQLLHALLNCLQYIGSFDTELAKTANKLLIDAGFGAF